VTSWQCQTISDISELEKIIDLEIEVWGLNPRDAMPTSILHAMATNGSLVAGAYDDTRLIGMAFAFPVPRNRQWMLWSHMTGIHPEYQNKGVGFALKQYQRTWALERGYKRIGWTYDPLQRGNANFNLHQLGATANIYLENFYGVMTDSINAGLPSDRLEVIWNLQQPRVKQLAAHKEPKSQIPIDAKPEDFLLRESGGSLPRLNIPLELSSTFYLAQIPGNLGVVKQASSDLAFQWRIALRVALQTAFSRGYSAQDFVAINDGHYYVLAAPQIWFLYVLECADQTLYTGITPDLHKRLTAHNKGRGASYTAARRPLKMVAAWQFATKENAMRAEHAFKKLSRSTKLHYLGRKLSFEEAPFLQIDF
jgi:predicted GNAT superfamily acetyltransferase